MPARSRALDDGTLFTDLELDGTAYSWRHYVRMLTSGPVALRLSLVDAVLSLSACMIYVAETYVRDEDDPVIDVFRMLEVGMAVFFALDYVLHAVDSSPPSAFIFSWASFLDLLTIVPVFVDMAGSSDASQFSFIRFLRVLRVFRILRVHRTFEFTNSPVKQQTCKIALTISSLLFISSGIYHLVESLAYFDDRDETFDFHQAFYFIVVTMSTVGYGDIYPMSDLGILVVVATICLSFILLPMEMHELRTIIALNSIYAKASFRKRAKSQQLLVCGHANNDGLRGFLLEVLHEDHGDVAVDVVLLIAEDPSPEMVHILTDNRFSDTLWYLAGSPMVDRDLRRASAHTADACFILANKFSTNPHEEDATAILNLLSLKHFAQHVAGVDLPMFIQVFLPSSKRHLEAVTDPQRANTIVCTQGLKMRLIGASVRCPGLATIVHNLVWSSSDQDDLTLPWRRQYAHGLAFEMYRIDLAESYRGHTFAHAAAAVYAEVGALLFALEIFDPRDPNVTSSVVMNPGDWPIPRDSPTVGVRAYVITEDVSAAHFVGHAVRAGNISKEKLAAMTRIKPQAPMPLGGTPEPRGKLRGFFQRARVVVDDAVEEFSDEKAGPPSAQATWESVRQTAVRPIGEAVVENVKACGRVVRQHVILVGSVNHVHALLEALQSCRNTKVVVLHPQLPSEEEWNEIAHMTNVLFVKGSALNHRDLVRAGVLEAAKGIILSKIRMGEADNSTVIDSEALFAFQAMESLNPDMTVLTELVCNDSMRFLAPRLSLTYTEYVLSPHFAAGQVFSASMMDMLLVQSFYHPTITAVVEALVHATHEHGGGPPGEESTPFLRQLVRDNPAFAGLRTAQLRLMPVPTHFVGLAYRELLHWLSGYGALPLGLMRAPGRVLGNVFPFVFVNPGAEAQLLSGDQMFVFAPPGFSVLPSPSPSDQQQFAFDAFDFGDSESKIAGPPQSVVHQQQPRSMWADPSLSLTTPTAQASRPSPSPSRKL